MDEKGDEYQPSKSLTIVETKFDASDADPDLTFEESFSSRNYAGSFRLRFSTTDASLRRGKQPTVIENVLARESNAATSQSEGKTGIDEQEETINLEQTIPNDTQQASLKFTEDRGKHLYKSVVYILDHGWRCP